MIRGKMKFTATWILPIVALASIGSLTYATSRPMIRDEETKKKDSHIVSKLVPFKHDTEIDTYLTSIRSYMLTPPRDGRFGGGRIPTFHGASRSSIPGYKEVEALGVDHSFASFVVGEMPKETIKAYAEYKAKNPDQNIEIPKYRSTLVHSMIKPQTGVSPRTNGFKQIPQSVVNDVKATVDKQGYDAYSHAVKIDGVEGWIMAKAVRASDKSCYGYHTTIKEGQPIGHVIAVLWNK